MTHLRSVVRTLLFTLLAFVAFPGIGAFAQTTTTYTFAGNGGFASNGYYTFNGIPLVDQSGTLSKTWIYEGNNAYTGKPYSWMLFTAGPLEGLNLTGTNCGAACFAYTLFVAHNGYPYGYPFPPTCGNSCSVLTASFSGTNPNTGLTVTANVSLDVFVYRACGGRTCVTDYEIYGGTVTVTE